jgi:hypothetical protein
MIDVPRASARRNLSKTPSTVSGDEPSVVKKNRVAKMESVWD